MSKPHLVFVHLTALHDSEHSSRARRSTSDAHAGATQKPATPSASIKGLTARISLRSFAINKIPRVPTTLSLCAIATERPIRRPIKVGACKPMARPIAAASPDLTDFPSHGFNLYQLRLAAQASSNKPPLDRLPPWYSQYRFAKSY